MTVRRRTRPLLALLAALSCVAGVLFGGGAAIASPQGDLSLLQSLSGTNISGTSATVAAGTGMNLALNYTCSTHDCLDSTVTVPLPAGMASGSPTLSADVASWSTSGTTVTFTMVHSIAAGTTGQIILPITVPGWTTPDGQVFSWQSTMTAPASPTATTATVTLTAHAGNAPTVTPSKSSGGALDQNTIYAVQACPNGSSQTGYGPLGIASGSSFTATLPTGAVFQSATGGGTYSSGTRKVTWTEQQLSSCATETVTVTYPSSDSSNTVGATKQVAASWTGHSIGEQTDRTLATGSASHTLIAPIIGMDFGKSVTPGSQMISKTVSYFLTASNTGNVQVDTMRVDDPVPTQVRVTSVVARNIGTTPANVYIGTRLGPDGIAGTSDDGQLELADTIAPGVTEAINPATTWPSGHAAIPAGDRIQQLRVDEGGIAPAAGSSVLWFDATLMSTAWDGTAVQSGDRFTNTGTFSYTVNGIAQPTVTRSADVTVVPQRPTLSVRTSAGGVLPAGQSATTLSTTVYVHDFDLPNPRLELLLPPKVTDGSWTGVDGGGGLPQPTETRFPDWNGVTGQTLLRFSWPTGTVLPAGDSYAVQVAAQLDPTAWGQLVTKGYASSTTMHPICDVDFFNSGVDTDDKDGDGDTTETLCNWNDSTSPAPSTSGSLSTGAHGAYTAGYGTTTVYTQPGSQDGYRLTLTNTGTIQLKNVVLVDVLPRPGDTKTLSSVGRNTSTGTFPVVLRGSPVLPSALASGSTVSYSTAQNPCRTDFAFSPSGCTAPAWQTTAPSDLSTVTAVRVDFGSQVIDPFTSWMVQLPVTTPVTGATEPDRADWNPDPNQPGNDEIAANSAAFLSTSVASNATLAPAESNLVRFDVPSHAGVSGVPPVVSPLTSSGTGTAAQTVTAVPPQQGTTALLNTTGQPVATLTVPGEGTYTADPATGTIVFHPALGFTGAATPVPYRVTNTFGDTADSTYSATVTTPAAPAPTARSSTGVGPADQQVTVTVPAGGSAALLDSGATVSVLTVPGKGVYRIDPATGVITFSPTIGFTGTAGPVPYRVTDAYGQHGDSTDSSTVTVPPAPAALPLVSTGVGVAVQTVIVAVPTGGSVHLLDGGGTPVTTVTRAGVGTWVLDPVTGRIVFTPVLGFQGTAAPLRYRTADAYGQSVDSTSTQTVLPPAGPVAVPVTSSADAAQHVTLSLPSDTTVTLLDANGAPATTVTTDEGAYTLDPATGRIDFSPAVGFHGRGGGVSYRLTDAYGQHDDATYIPTVTSSPMPAVGAKATSGTGTVAQSTVLPVPAGGSVSLVDAAGAPVGSVTVPSVGTFVLDPVTGRVSFQAVLGFTGTASVSFQVRSASGELRTATYTVRVAPPAGPIARPLTSTLPAHSLVQHAQVTVPRGDTAALLDHAGRSVTEVRISGVGVYRYDRAHARITFTPQGGFVGTPDPVRYVLLDAYGQRSSAAYQPAGYPAATGPALASTGADASPLGLLAGILLSIGCVLVALRFRAARRLRR